MLTGYRGVIFALVGLGLLSWVFAQGWLLGAWVQPPYQHTISSQTGQQALHTALLATDYAAYPDKNAERCYEAKNHDSADLCAQWRAAIAAEKSAEVGETSNYVAAAGAILTFISVVLVLIALRQTERALGQTKEANDISRETAKSQLRAYVTTEDHMLVGFLAGGPSVFQLKVWNRGQSPAHAVRIWSMVTATQGEPDTAKIRRVILPSFRQSSGVLGPGQWVLHENDCQGPLNPDSHFAVMLGGVAIIFAGVISYRDIFGKRHFTAFKYFYRGSGPSTETTFDLSACGRGNIST